MAKQRQQLEAFDVAEFLRPTDDDLKSALSSLLRDGNSFDSQGADPVSNTEIPSGPSPLTEFPASISPVEAAYIPEPASSSSGTVKQAGNRLNNHSRVARSLLTKDHPRTKTGSRPMAPADSLFDISLYINRARTAYRLNRTELVLYEVFLNWTHALGETRCEVTNRKLCEESGLIEKTIRRNLKSLKERGLVNQVKAYDPYTHESAVYDVSLPDLI